MLTYLETHPPLSYPTVKPFWSRHSDHQLWNRVEHKSAHVSMCVALYPFELVMNDTHKFHSKKAACSGNQSHFANLRTERGEQLLAKLVICKWQSCAEQDMWFWADCIHKQPEASIYIACSMWWRPEAGRQVRFVWRPWCLVGGYVGKWWIGRHRWGD